MQPENARRIIRIVVKLPWREPKCVSRLSPEIRRFEIIEALAWSEELEQSQRVFLPITTRNIRQAPLSMTILEISAMLLKLCEMLWSRRIRFFRISGSSAMTMTALKNSSTTSRMDASERSAAP